MGQTIAVGLIVAAALVYIVVKLRKNTGGKGCGCGCSGCSDNNKIKNCEIK